MIELIIIGIIGGFFSGFFGIGGGTIIVPLLIYVGFSMKEAVGISIIQMVFSSYYGSFLNHKRGFLNAKSGLTLGIGGAIGAFGSGFVVKNVDDMFLKYLFLGVILFAIFRFFNASASSDKEPIENSILIFFIGMGVGVIAISIGIGGSLLLTPILVSFLHFHVKRATALALFFIIFSSTSGFISMSINGIIDLKNGLIVGIASLIGVYIGVHIAEKVDSKRYKNYILSLYIFVLIIFIYRITQ